MIKKQPTPKTSLYLARNKLLNALFSEESLAAELIQTRKELYKEIIALSKADFTLKKGEFEQDFLNQYYDSLLPEIQQVKRFLTLK